jgi:hypothetical protein
MPLITFGNNTKLKLKIPSKGDTNWSEDFKTYFVDPIVEHDHSGINGRGKKLTADALEDGSIEAQHVNFRLRDLTDVLDAEPSSGQYLKYVNGSWQGGSVDVEESTINNAGSGAGTIGDDTSGVNLDPNAELFISDVQGGDTLDFTGREGGELVGVKVIIDSDTTQDKSAKFASLKECIIISNIDIEVTGKIDKCVIIMENDEVTAGTEGCNLILSSVENGPDEVNFIVKGSKIIADTIEVNNATSIERHLFLDSEIKTQELNLQLLGGADSNKTKITRSNVDVSVKITNSNDISSVSGAEKLKLTNSKVAFPVFEHLVNSALVTYTMSNAFINVGDNSEFKQVSSNYVKIWRQSADRWNYLVSPSSKGGLISSDSNGIPTQINVGSNNQILTANSSTPTGLEWQAQSSVLATANLQDFANVNTSGVTSGQFLKYDGSNWVDTSILQVPSGGSTGQILTKTSSGYAWQTKTEKSFVKIHSTGSGSHNPTNQGNTTIVSVPSGNYYAEVTVGLTLYVNERGPALPATYIVPAGGSLSLSWDSNNNTLFIGGQRFDTSSTSSGIVTYSYVIFTNS